MQALIDGLQLLEKDASATIIWNGNAYPCVGGAEFGGKLLGSGGFRTTAQVTIIVRAASFGATRPVEKNRISYVSAPGAPARALRIDSLTLFRNAMLVLECNDPTQGA